MARQADRNQFNRELEARIGEITAAFDKKLASHTSKDSTNTADKSTKQTGAKPKQQSFRTTEQEDNKQGDDDDEEQVSPSYYTIDDLEPNQNQEFIDSKKWSVNQTPEMSVNNKNSFSVFRLPKLDLQPFDGDSKKWADFIAIYRDLLHQNSSISTTQKMAILKQCLTQDIRDGLGDSLSSPALYDKALRELEETYGHPQLVSRSYIQSLINLPKLNSRLTTTSRY